MDPRVTNVGSDLDADGLKDLEELQIGSDVLNPDTDGDGLKDGREKKLGTSILDPDTDDDGFNDGFEVAHLYDPISTFNNPNSHWLFLLVSIAIFMTYIRLSTGSIHSRKFNSLSPEDQHQRRASRD